MKKLIAIMIAALMLASLLCVGSGATVLFRDPFDTWTSYWIGYNDPQQGGDLNEITNYNGENVLEGWEEARVHQAAYENDEETGFGYAATKSSLMTGTVWVDLMCETTDWDDAGAGLWWKNTYHEKHEGAESADTYLLKYYPGTSTVKFMRDYPGSTTDEERTLIVWEDPRAMGNNMNTPITLGLRIESGKISAFVDGNWIYTYEDASLGVDACPVLLWNDSLHAIWDNYCVGDLEELPLPTGTGDTTAPVNGTTAPGVTTAPGETTAPVAGTETYYKEVVKEKTVVVGTDDQGNEITEIVTEIVTELASREVANTDGTNPSATNGGSQTGDTALIVVAVMIAALGSAIVVKKVSDR